MVELIALAKKNHLITIFSSAMFLTLFLPMFHFVSPENIRKHENFPDVFWEIKREHWEGKC